MSEPIRLDVCGLSCPQPVLRVTEALRQLTGGLVEVLADCGTAQDNVTRLAERSGWSVRTEARPDGSVRLELQR
jgi:tRNA 2-thiouridine synthesizing protein A